MTEEVLTISELNHYIKDVLDAGFPQSLWICGEIQNYDRNKNRTHVFFELIEKDTTSNDIVAKTSLVIFANRKSHIANVLAQSENAFALKDDIEVKFRCKVNFYEAGGSINLIVEDIDPVYTLGKLAQEKQKLIALLKKDGIFDKNKQLSLSPVPLRLGLITADDSAAFNDFVSELNKSKYHFKVFVRHAVMQGKKTEADICRAIDELVKLQKLDTIIITRGGGSLADLSAFDSQKIAEKISETSLPILSGIGHEINITIADLAAHTYAKTPTAIAQFLVGRVDDYLQTLSVRLDRVMELAEENIEERKNRLKDCVLSLEQSTRAYFEDHHRKILLFAEVLKTRPRGVFKETKKSLADQAQELKRIVKTRLQQDHMKLKGIDKILHFAHPTNTLKRGFSITRDATGTLVRKSTQLKKDAVLTTELVDGKVKSLVQSIDQRKE